MNALALLTSTEGRLGRKPFFLWVLAIYLAGFAAQLLLAPQVTARGGVWPFVLAQAILIWAWLAVHIKRLRDAGQGPAGAIGVALIYALAIVLLLLMVAFLTNPNAPSGPGDDNAFSLLLLIVIFSLLFSPDFGVFMTILKLIILIACLPAIVALVFSVVTGLRKSLA